MKHLSDSEFERQFAACTLDPSLFTHEAHLRLAWIHVTKYGPAIAIENICTQIQTYDKVFGDGTKYHVTVTIASVFIMDHFIRRSHSQTFNDFMIEFPRLRTHFKEILAQHYVTDIFKDVEAKDIYVAPDLQPF
jgi:hypothetical protein